MLPRLCGRLITPRRFFLLLLIILLSIIHHRLTRNNDENENNKIYYYAFEEPLEETYISSIVIKKKYLSGEWIQNVESYGSIKENSVIFVVLVDKFSSDFNGFLTSLSEVQGIEEAFVIFSHSYYNEAVNTIIQGINFCRVLQIFYPYSVQIHPQTFPGRHPNDCHPNMSRKIATAINCTGALYPDVRGHYRNPLKAERKHHWWWTANQIFEKLNCTAKHTGLVIFLEDNFIFMKDFIYMALYMKNIAGSLPQCEFLSMGTESVSNTDEDNIYVAELTTWDPKIHSSVLAFNVTTWNIIVAHYDIFCNFDDSSWTNSLNFISYKKFGKKFKVISTLTPRAIKMDACGFNDAQPFGCDVRKKIDEAKSFEKDNKDNWFPPHVELYINILDTEIEADGDFTFDYGESTGGWSDPRDIALCRNMTSGKLKKILMEMQSDFG